MKNKIIQALSFSFVIFLASTSFAQVETEPIKEEQTKEVSTTLTTPEIVSLADEMPRFPGCEDKDMSIEEKNGCARGAMLTYVYKNLKFPAEARSQKINGKAIVQFLITAEGKIEDITLKKDLEGGCGQAAIDVVTKMQSEKIWVPGKKDGNAVDVPYTLPIRFRS